MCGLTGAVIGHRPARRMKDIEALADVFTAMLLLSEHRGPYATGVAWVKKDGTMQVAKEPLLARQFVQTGSYLNWLLGIDRQITYLMGHTRWPSRGHVRNPDENHPICCAPPILVTHYAESEFMLSQRAIPVWPRLIPAIHQHIIFRFPVIRLDLFRASSDELAPVPSGGNADVRRRRSPRCVG